MSQIEERPGRQAPALRVILLALAAAAAAMALVNYLQKDKSPFSPAGWAVFLVGAIIAALVCRAVARHPSCQVGTRAVVMMGIGAALYGLLSTTTNWMMLSPVSPVSLRPAIAIPVLFGALFGPVVGFFVGAVGNILGDAVSGYGVYPAWDLGNGLVGLIAGLALVFRDRRSAINAAAAFTIAAAAITAFVEWQSKDLTFKNPLSGQTVNHHAWWWVMAAGALVIAAVRIGLRNNPEVLAVVLWGVLGVVIGLGAAAVSDIWVNGYTPVVALVGEFIPAAGPDIILVVILVPILYAAYQGAMTRAGR